MICWNTHADFTAIVKKAVKDLTPHVDEWDSVVSGGLSGLLVAAPVAVELNKPLVVVSRNEDGKHAGRCHGFVGAKRALFIDDHFGGGNTFRQCREKLTMNPQGEIPFPEGVKAFDERNGKGSAKRYYPHWFEDFKSENEIVAIYMYNPTHSRTDYGGYHHVTEDAMEKINRFGLWPADVFKELHEGEKSVKPVKKAVKAAVVRSRATSLNVSRRAKLSPVTASKRVAKV